MTKQPYQTPSIEQQQKLSTITEGDALIISGVEIPRG